MKKIRFFYFQFIKEIRWEMGCGKGKFLFICMIMICFMSTLIDTANICVFDCSSICWMNFIERIIWIVCEWGWKIDGVFGMGLCLTYFHGFCWILMALV